jgi:hypothetical protein
MKTDFRLALSKRFLVGLLLSSAIMRLFFFFVYLPNMPSKFGPDEGTYGTLADYVANGFPVQDFPAYGPGLYNSARTLIVPSSVLVRIGMGQLDSVRLVSSFYGLFALLIFIMSIIAIQRRNSKTGNLEEIELNNTNKVVLILYAFFPSYFLWSNLGLRESASQLFLISTFYLCIKLVDAQRFKSWIIIAITPIFLMLAFGSRPETAMVFTICAFIFSLVLLWNTRNYSIAFVVLVGFLLGQAFTTTPTVQASEVLVARLLTGTETKSPQPTQSTETKSPQPTQSTETKSPQPTQSTETKSPQPKENSEISKLCKVENQILKSKGYKFRCIATKQYLVSERNPIEQVKTLAETTQTLEYKRNVNRLDAISALPVSSCNLTSLVQRLSCNIEELPYRLTAFLIRPFPGIDSGANFQNLAGFENILWLFLISLGMIRVIRKWKIQENRLINSFLLSFIICFSTAAALYEGNLGTAFRHKSTILWSLLLILILTKRSKILRDENFLEFHE